MINYTFLRVVLSLLLGSSFSTEIPKNLLDTFQVYSFHNVIGGNLNISGYLNSINSDRSLENPLAKMNVSEVIHYYGYGVEAYDSVTGDGYILRLHRITGNMTNSDPVGKPAVLLQHGLFCSSMDWVITGPGRGLGFILSDAGYDVWMGNARGNKYSRRHVNLDPNGSDFWNFSWHEIGVEDLPAMINAIISVTGNEKIFYVGHSQGTTAFYVMLSERPEYNEKITAMFSLAPVAYCSRATSPLFRALGKLGPAIEVVKKFFGEHEVLPTNEFFKKFTAIVCDKDSKFSALCKNILFLICGFDEKQFDKELLPLILAHTPAGASTKQVIHYAQLMKSGFFCKYDYGSLANLIKYRQFKPPMYKLENIRVPVALHYSINDWLSHPMDVYELYSQLPNPIGGFRVPYDEFNHLDYLWAKDVKKLLYDKIITLLNRFLPEED